MDISLAKSIYDHATTVKNNKIPNEAKRVIEKYSAFQKNNPSLPSIAPFCELDCHGSIIKLLSRHGEDKIDTIIEALEPLIPKFNDEECLKGKVAIHSRAFKEPVIIKFPKDQESVRHIEKQNSERNKELSLFLDSILKEANFRETEWLEFKTNFSKIESERLGRTLSGLSNTASVKNVQYAYLIYGINEPKREISGTNFNTETNAWKNIELELRQSFNPSIKYEILEFNYNENPQQHIVIFKIYAAGGEPVAYCGVPFFRKDDKTIPLKDYPNLLKNISNPTSQQPIDNNIIVIIQQPKFIFNFNSGNTIIDSNNTNSNNNIDNSPNTNIGSNNKDNHGTEINIAPSQNKTSFIRWLIGVLFSGAGIFLLQQCFFSSDNKVSIKEEKNTTKPIESSNSLEQISQDVTINQENFNTTTSIYEKKNQSYADSNNTEGKKDVINSLSSTSQPIPKDKSISSISVKKIQLSLDERYTVCSLYKGADTISTSSSYAKGLLISLISDYNDFAQSNGLKTFDNNPDNYGYSGFLDETGVAVLSSIKRSLENIIKSNKIRCK